jgi:thioredoxin 1
MPVMEVTDISSIRNGNVIVDFYSQTCGPCKKLNTFMEEIALEFDDIQVAKVDVMQNPDMSQMFGIMSVPTVIFMKDCQVVQTIRGLSPKEDLKSLVRSFSGKH